MLIELANKYNNVLLKLNTNGIVEPSSIERTDVFLYAETLYYQDLNIY